ncbi:MAG: hypothetical protein AB7V26_06360 [Lysobacterales bacterium]
MTTVFIALLDFIGTFALEQMNLPKNIAIAGGFQAPAATAWTP